MYIALLKLFHSISFEHSVGDDFVLSIHHEKRKLARAAFIIVHYLEEQC
jgi:hypothetical protein